MKDLIGAEMTNGEKIMQAFPNLQIDMGELEVYMWTTTHDAIDIPLEWWNAEYKEPASKNDLTGDCISRDEVCRYVAEFVNHEFSTRVEEELIDNIITGIESMPSVTPQEPRWIPVSERLPEKNMRCLVAVGRFNFTEIATYSDLMGIIDHKIFYQGDVGHDNYKNITQYVKAWMPLSSSYREVE